MSTKKATNSELSDLIAEIEAIDEQRKDLLSDRNEVIERCAALDYPGKIIRKIVERRRKDRAAILEGDRLLREFEAELGMKDKI